MGKLKKSITQLSKRKLNIKKKDLDRETDKISALLSGNINKYEFLTGKDVSLEKDLLQKTATTKQIGYLPLDKELKSQTDIAMKQYQKLDDTFIFDKIIEKGNTRKL